MPPLSGTSRAPGELRSLQILRAVASTSVVYFHIGAIPVFGSFGVDVFFVISGFVMAMVVQGGQTPAVFAASRISRIVPLYWVMTTALLVLTVVKPELLTSTRFNIGNYLKSLSFIPYFKENGDLHPMLTVGWTLNYEMFFYACVWLALVVARQAFLPLTLLLIGAAYLLLGQGSDDPVLRGFFGSTLVFEFGFGMLAFQLYRSGMLRAVGRGPLLAIALIAFAFMAWAEATELARGLPMLVYGLPSLALVLAAVGLEQAGAIGTQPAWGWLTVVGDASYATYLSNLYVVEGVRKIGFERLHLFDPYTPFGVAVILASSLLVGHLLYTGCDRPLSRRMKRWLLSLWSPRPRGATLRP